MLICTLSIILQDYTMFLPLYAVSLLYSWNTDKNYYNVLFRISWGIFLSRCEFSPADHPGVFVITKSIADKVRGQQSRCDRSRLCMYLKRFYALSPRHFMQNLTNTLGTFVVSREPFWNRFLLSWSID